MSGTKKEIETWGSMSQPRIVIIGAGIAGITAANSLCNAGYDNIKILEATDRTGGRIWSVDVAAGSKVEMGANWIHGIERNPIYQIADENNLLQVRNKDKNFRSRDVYLTEDGDTVNEKTVKEIDWTYGLLIQQCEDFFQSQIPTPEENDSVGAFLDREFSDKLDQYSNGDKRLRDLIFSQRKRLECCITGCDSLNDVSLSEFGGYEELPGVHYTIPPGFETILEILKKNIPKDSITLNCPVTSIQWNNSDRNDNHNLVRVKCENGEEILADHVICTVSLGVLKAMAGRMFNPPLPENKLHAIELMGFGIVDKVILEFDENVLESDVCRVGLLFEINDNECNQDLKNTWYKKIYSFEVVAENVLLCWLCGKEALYMECLPDDKIAEDCVFLLKKFLKRNDIPHPKKIRRTKWGNNQYTKGSYSFVAVGCTGTEIEALQEPLQREGADKPQVLFAGEATHSTFYSTTHGALLSGKREAQRIIDLYQE